jgi:hypothetical protein
MSPRTGQSPLPDPRAQAVAAAAPAAAWPDLRARLAAELDAAADARADLARRLEAALEVRTPYFALLVAPRTLQADLERCCMCAQVRRESARQGAALDEMRRRVDLLRARADELVVRRSRAAEGVERRREELQTQMTERVLPLARALDVARCQVQVTTIQSCPFPSTQIAARLDCELRSPALPRQRLLVAGGQGGAVWREGAARGSPEAAQGEPAEHGEPGRRAVPCQGLP